MRADSVRSRAVLLSAATLAVLCIDLFSATDISVYLLYGIIILAVPRLIGRGHTVRVATILSALVVTGYFATSRDYHPLLEASTRMVVIITIWIIAVNSRRHQLIEVLEQGILENDTNAIILVDEQRCIRLFNPAAESIFGYRKEDIIGHDISRILPGSGNVMPVGDQVSATGHYCSKHEFAGYHLDGGRIIVELRIRPLDAYKKGNLLYILQDITERRQRDLRLSDELELNHRLMITARCIFLILDTRARIQDYNPYFEELTGYPLDTMRGRDWFEVFRNGTDDQERRRLFEATLAGADTDGTVTTIITARGDQRTIIWSSNPIRDDSGTLTGLLCAGQDITDNELAQHDLMVRTGQLVSLSEIAYQALQEQLFHKLIQFIEKHIFNVFNAAKITYLELNEDRIRVQSCAITRTGQFSVNELALPLV